MISARFIAAYIRLQYTIQRQEKAMNLLSHIASNELHRPLRVELDSSGNIKFMASKGSDDKSMTIPISLKQIMNFK